MKIRFKKDIWLVKSEGGGFAGTYINKATMIEGQIDFDIISISKKTEYSVDIFVWSDGNCDGECLFILNVPKNTYDIIEKSDANN